VLPYSLTSPVFEIASIASSSAIVHLAVFSGLALFEAGLIRLKNSVTFVAQIFMGVAVLSIMWLLFGFSLSHGEDNGGFIGGFANAMFDGISYTECFSNMIVSQASYATFMMMFAIICPLLMTGGYAERLPFPAFLCVTILWEVIVYYPVSHWVRTAAASWRPSQTHLN
jgi:Amt family ammonium transporter